MPLCDKVKWASWKKKKKHKKNTYNNWDIITHIAHHNHNTYNNWDIIRFYFHLVLWGLTSFPVQVCFTHPSLQFQANDVKWFWSYGFTDTDQWQQCQLSPITPRNISKISKALHVTWCPTAAELIINQQIGYLENLIIQNTFSILRLLFRVT